MVVISVSKTGCNRNRFLYAIVFCPPSPPFYAKFSTKCELCYGGTLNFLKQKIACGDFLLMKIRGVPSRTRTCNLLLRRQLLYPIEPWAHNATHYNLFFSKNKDAILLATDHLY